MQWHAAKRGSTIEKLANGWQKSMAQAYEKLRQAKQYVFRGQGQRTPTGSLTLNPIQRRISSNLNLNLNLNQSPNLNLNLNPSLNQRWSHQIRAVSRLSSQPYSRWGNLFGERH